MTIRERTWEVMILVTIACAAFLMMFVGVSTWSGLSQPIVVSTDSFHSAGQGANWIYRDIAIDDVRNNIYGEGVISKARSYLDGFVDFLESRLENPFGLWSRGESNRGQQLEDENGVVANVKSFLMGIGDAIRNWGQKTISPPAILHATEPLSVFTQSGLSPASSLASRLSAIVGKVMEAYYADNVLTEEEQSCSGTLEKQTKKLIKSVKHELKEKLCDGQYQSANEEDFCNFFRRFPRMATLMVFAKLEVDPVGVALMRTTTSELCASSNGDLLRIIHKMGKLARRLDFSLQGIGHNRLAVHEDEHDEHEHVKREHEYEREEHEHEREKEAGDSCKVCYKEGIENLKEKIRSVIAATCSSDSRGGKPPCSYMAEVCTFYPEHRYLIKTYLFLKLRVWEVLSMTCASSCSSSSGYTLPDEAEFGQLAVSESHAPNLPVFHNGLFRLDTERPGFIVSSPVMPVSQPTRIGVVVERKGYRCRRLARMQAFRRAMQLRGSFLGSEGHDGASGYKGNRQTHLVVVVNGHPFVQFQQQSSGGIFSDLQNQMDRVVSNFPDPRPELFMSLFEHLRAVSEDDSSVARNINSEPSDQTLHEPQEEIPRQGIFSQEPVVSDVIEESQSTDNVDTTLGNNSEMFTSTDDDLGMYEGSSHAAI